MIVYINGYFLTQKTAGVQRFALNLLSQIDLLLLKQQSASLEVRCLVPYDIQYEFKNIKVQVIQSKIRAIDTRQTLWEQLVLPLAVKGKFLLNFCNFAPIFKHNQLIVVHDVIPFRYPEAVGKMWGWLFRFIVKRFAKNSKYLATVSRFSAQELQVVTHIKRHIIVLGNSADHLNRITPDNSILARFNLKPKKYVLTVSSQASIAYKNFVLLEKAATRLDFPLIAVGSATNATSQNNICYTGRVNDDELKALYANAYAFIFPSLYEGFGIPPLEAMACGAPVIAADIPVLHEVCGNAAIYFNPYDALDLVNACKMLSSDKVSELVTQGYSQVYNYSWQKHAQALLNVIATEMDVLK
jgi:glycosyltransferase involved in cell wall biosynthesis